MAKILVVDDDARNLRLAVTALEQAGHEVLSAAPRAWFSACLRDTLDGVLVDDYQLVGFNQCGSLRPRSRDKVMEFTHFHVADTNMNNPRRRFGKDDAIGEVRILRNDNEVFLASMVPNLAVGPGVVKIEDVGECRTVPEIESVRQVGVDRVRRLSPNRIGCPSIARQIAGRP